MGIEQMKVNTVETNETRDERRESIFKKHKNKIILAVAGIIGFGGAGKATIDSLEDFKNNPANIKFANENKDIKDIQKTWSEKEGELTKEIQEKDEAAK